MISEALPKGQVRLHFVDAERKFCADWARERVARARGQQIVDLRRGGQSGSIGDWVGCMNEYGLAEELGYDARLLRAADNGPSASDFPPLMPELVIQIKVRLDPRHSWLIVPLHQLGGVTPQTILINARVTADPHQEPRFDIDLLGWIGGADFRAKHRIEVPRPGGDCAVMESAALAPLIGGDNALLWFLRRHLQLKRENVELITEAALCKTA
jgi:hypothetical protein